MLPDGVEANINTWVIDTPPIFNMIQELGNIHIDEMYSTFNMGVGMVFVISKEDFTKYRKSI